MFVPGIAHLSALLEGFIVQREEYLLQDVGHTFSEQFVKRAGFHILSGDLNFFSKQFGIEGRGTVRCQPDCREGIWKRKRKWGKQKEVVNDKLQIKLEDVLGMNSIFYFPYNVTNNIINYLIIC